VMHDERHKEKRSYGRKNKVAQSEPGARKQLAAC